MEEQQESNPTVKKSQLYCPLTQNRKFEVFLSYLAEMEKSQALKNADIIEYVKNVETYYMSQIRSFRLAKEKHIQRVKAVTNLQAKEVSDRTELLEIFQDTVEKVKAQIIRRKNQSGATLLKSNSHIEIEESLLKLDEFGKDKISYSEFTETDKKSLLEIFLLHETTLQAMQKQIFAKKEDSKSFTLAGPHV